MSFHEGSNFQASREDQGKKMYGNEVVNTKKELNHAKFANMRPNLFILRSSKGFSLKEADRQILKSTVQRWEQLECRIGYPTLDEMMLISEYFEVPINDILHKKYKIVFE